MCVCKYYSSNRMFFKKVFLNICNVWILQKIMKGISYKSIVTGTKYVQWEDEMFEIITNAILP